MPNVQLAPAPAPRTLNAAYARAVVEHIQREQPGLIDELDERQRSFLDLKNPLDRCTLEEWHTLLKTAEQLLNTSDLVPQLADNFKPWHAGLLGFTLMTCETIGRLATLLRRFHHLLNDVFTVEHGTTLSRFFLTLRANTNERSPQLERLSLCIWAHRLRWLTGQVDLRLDVDFQSPPPNDTGPYSRLFGGLVRFDQSSGTMWGDVACCGMHIASRDTASHSILHTRALQQLEQISNQSALFNEQLQRLIGDRLSHGSCMIEDIATAMHLTPRTLQRRLKEENLNFRHMVESVRRTKAEHYLRETNMPLAALALSLGFSDHSSFNRAFKRWTHLSPGAYRRAHTTTNN